MNKIEELERDLTVAYLNYENDDLKETLKYLDRMLALILNDDKSLENDPFWKTLTCDVFKAIVLNNFYNKKEMTGNDLDSLLGNIEEMKRNIQEFCNNFKDNNLIDFINHIENITDKPLESVIKIIMVNIGKMNISTIKTSQVNNSNETESNMSKSNYEKQEFIKIFIEKQNEVKIDDEHKLILLNVDEFVNNIKNNSNRVPMGHIQVVLKYKVVHKNYVYYGESIFDSYSDIKNKIDENSPYKVELINWKLSDKEEKYLEFNFIKVNNRNYKETFSTEGLKEIMEHVHGNESSNGKNNEFNLEMNVENVFETWNEIKIKNLDLKDFFEETEKEAINELNYAKNKATIKGKSLAEYLINDEIDCKDKTIQLIISYFGLTSLYDMKFTNESDIPCEEISIDNVGLFRAVLMINIIAKLDSVVSMGLPLNIKFTFERKEFAEILSPMLNYYIPKIFININEIKILYK